ncbi:MAG TPA: hypothetical protein VFS43_37470 [Polyangiaceae bacterium]|nr:hypothetical protein [Polyangiaceae bacterium]
MAPAEPPPKGPRPLELALAAAVAAAAMLRAPASPTWRADAALLRATDLSFGPSGNVAALLGWFARFLPLGTETYRQSLPVALAAGLAAAALARLARGPLAAPGAHPWLSGLLASFAALGACLSPTFQREALAPGGGALAAGLALATLAVALGGGGHGRSALAGALWAQTFVESPWAALALGAALLADGATAGPRPPGRAKAWAAGALAGALPWALLAAARAPVVSDPWAGAWAALSGGEGRAARGPAAFVEEIGLPTALAALGGLALAARGREARAPAWLLAASLPACFLAAGDPRSPDPFAATRALALAALALGASAALGRAIGALSSTPLPLGRPAASLAGLLALARVVMAADEGVQAGAEGRGAVEAWTDEALEGLPAGAALLVRSKPFADRLLVAQTVEGRRDDLLVVPLGSATRGRVASGLLAREPALATLVRDQALYGAPSEYALASLASVRPLYVEGGPARARRVASHAAPEALWLRFWQQPVGASERRAGQEQAGRSIERVLAAARPAGGVDEATRRALVAHVVDELELALALNERELVDGAWARLVPLEPEGSWLPPDETQGRPGSPEGRRRRARR